MQPLVRPDAEQIGLELGRLVEVVRPQAGDPARVAVILDAAAPRNIVARPVDSAIVAARAPCSVKCSVVRKLTAAGRGSSTVGTLKRASVVVTDERRVSLDQAP